MKASELIAQLQALVDQQGDVDVEAFTDEFKQVTFCFWQEGAVPQKEES